MTDPNGKQILVLTNAPAPYRLPLFNEVDQQLRETAGLRLHVFFACAEHRDRRWVVAMEEARFPYSTAAGRRLPGRHEFERHLYDGIGGALRRLQPILVLVDGFSVGALRISLQISRQRVPYLIWGGAIADEPSCLSGLRRLQRRWIVARAHGAIALSSKAAGYMVALGMRKENITVALNAIDDSAFPPKPYQSPDTPCPYRFITVGTLNRRKRVDRLISSAAVLASAARTFEIAIVGEGPERRTLEQQVRDAGLEGQVRFFGHLDRADVAALLRNSDCFVFPTGHDIWGLVLNEAMLTGLPVIASTQAAATHDLVVNDYNGFAVDFDDCNTVASCMQQLLGDQEKTVKLGRAARETVLARASLYDSAHRWSEAILKAVDTSSSKRLDCAGEYQSPVA